jgi:hypothetical protein
MENIFIRKLITLVLVFVAHSTAIAQLTGEPRDDFTTSFYHSCQTPKPASKEDGIKRVRLCNCLSMKLADSLDNETLKMIEKEQRSLDSGLMENTVSWCKQNYMEYSEAPPVSEIAKNKNTNSSILFNGETHRFTAFRQYAYTKEFQLVRTVELENGKYLYDINIQPGRSRNTIVDLTSRREYSLAPLAGTAPRAIAVGFDFAFFITESAGFLLIDSKKNLLTTQVFDEKNGLFYETHYVRSQALICTALSEAKSRVQKSVAVSIFKEILLIAIKSYAGTSYSGGNFTAYTSNGTTVSGTYTKYDNSWLGEHYSRGLDAVFNGTASLSQINTEINRLNCGAL